MRNLLTARTDARRRRRRLASEIASYQTPAERLELELVLARHTPEQGAEVERILRRQEAARRYQGSGTGSI